jgi:cytidine deaminase
MRNINFKDLSPAQQELLSAAEEALKRSFNPQTGFSVGAAIRGENGSIYKGTNMENFSLTPPVICAERAALVNANVGGCRTFTEIAIIARAKDGPTREVSAPCGVCRQMLFEMAQIGSKDIEIILSTTNKDKIAVTSIKELLPLGFGPRDLGIDASIYR